jgi:thiol-disulfide isomerase/thioredoxin
MTTSEASPRKHSVLKILVPVAVIGALAGAGLFALSRLAQDPGNGESIAIVAGATLPDFELQKLDGTQSKFSDLAASGTKVVMVNFWATWCESCVIEMPSIVELRRSFKAKGFEVVAVNVDENPAAVVPKAVRQLGIDFPVYIDPGTNLADLFDVHAIPLTVIIDRTGKVLFVESGERNWNGSDIREQMERWLSG